MMKQALGTAAAAVFATAIAGAQAPAAQQGQDSPSSHQMVTVEGCLQQDRAGSARVADAARDDNKEFMLVSAQVQSGTAASATTSEPAGTTAQAERPVGTSGTAAGATKFKVTGLDDDRLAQYAGQRVRIQGHIEDSEDRGATGSDGSDAARADADRPTADTAPSSAAGTAGTTGSASGDHRSHAAAGDVAKLKATSIQAASGSCPPSSDAR